MNEINSAIEIKELATNSSSAGEVAALLPPTWNSRQQPDVLDIRSRNLLGSASGVLAETNFDLLTHLREVYDRAISVFAFGATGAADSFCRLMPPGLSHFGKASIKSRSVRVLPGPPIKPISYGENGRAYVFQNWLGQRSGQRRKRLTLLAESSSVIADPRSIDRGRIRIIKMHSPLPEIIFEKPNLNRQIADAKKKAVT